MKKIYTLVSCVLISAAASAQAPYQMATYDFAPNQKYSPGAISVIPMRTVDQNQDRTTYYSENFDAGLGAWTSAIQAGAGGFQGFKITNTGHVNLPSNTFIIPILATSTPTNWVLLDSDGDAGANYSIPEAATLISPVIDLSGSFGEYVALEFDQFFAEWQPTTGDTEDHCYIAVSTDGTTWEEIEINEGVGRDGRPNPELVSWDISDYIAGNLSTVQFRFRWSGAWNYGWQIDNVKVVDINEKDLSIIGSYRNYNASGLMFSKVPVAHASEFTVGAVIRNIGHLDQTGVTFSYVIRDPSNAVVASGTAPTSLSLTNAQQDTILVATGYTPSDLGVYTVEWTLISNEGDDDLSNNTKSDNFFELTQYTYAMDYNEGTPVGITNWPLKVGEATFGNLFSFEQNDVISSLQVKIANNPINVGEEIYTSVFFNDGATWQSLFLGDEYTVQAGDIGQIITIPFPDGIDVNATDLYLFQIGQYATPAQPLFERQGDIGFSYIQGRDDEAANRGFFDRLAPIVRIRANEAELAINETTTVTKFVVYPNPATDALNVNLTLTESTNTVINILDITGKVVKSIAIGDLNGEKNLTISLEEMNSGIYFIELLNADGRQVKKFVKK